MSKLHFLDSLRGWVVGDSGTVLKTTNGGQQWLIIDPGIPNDLHDVYMLDTARGWMLAYEFPCDTCSWWGTIISRTNDGGSTWSHTNYSEMFFNTIVFMDSMKGWMAGALGTLLRTTDGGSQWSSVRVDSTFESFPIWRLKFQSPRVGFAVGGFREITGVVWKSTDFGVNWTVRRVGEEMRGVDFLDSLNIVVTGGGFDDGVAVARSTDGGDTWDFEYLGVFGRADAVSFRTPREAWAPLGFSGRMMKTSDRGATWSYMFAPESTAAFDMVFTDSLTGYMVGVGGTILKFNAGTMGVSDNVSRAAPVGFALMQNYPNPFNPVTTIGFRIQTTSRTLLKILNLVGQEVAELVNEVKGPGYYEVRFDATDLPSGVYFYRLQAGAFVQTKKLVIVR